MIALTVTNVTGVTVGDVTGILAAITALVTAITALIHSIKTRSFTKDNQNEIEKLKQNGKS